MAAPVAREHEGASTASLTASLANVAASLQAEKSNAELFENCAFFRLLFEYDLKRTSVLLCTSIVSKGSSNPPSVAGGHHYTGAGGM